MGLARSTVVSSVYGKIKQLLFTYPGLLREPQDVIRIYNGIQRGLPPDVHYVLLAPYDAAGFYASRFQREQTVQLLPADLLEYAGCHDPRLSVVVYDDRLKLSISEWAQDHLAVLQEEGAPTLLSALNTKPRRGDGNAWITDMLAAELNLRSTKTKYMFEGGDLLAGDAYVLAGRTLLDRNLVRGDDRELVRSRLTEDFQRRLGVREVIWIDQTPDGGQQWRNPSALRSLDGLLHHIDLYLTLGGKDPSGRELIFVGEVRERYCVNIGTQQQQVALLRDGLDELALRLEEGIAQSTKFRVVRLPLIVDYDEGGTTGFIARPYNNCLIEVYDDQRNVYLPRYERSANGRKNVFAQAEEDARRVFRAEGFSVRMVDESFVHRSANKGSFHCITKVLRRGAYLRDQVQDEPWQDRVSSAATVNDSAQRPLKIFVGYSHADAQHLAKERLLTVLDGLRHDNFTYWFDRDLLIGDVWHQVIIRQIKQADIALFLISQHFLDSDYCRNTEVRECLEQASRRGMPIVPIILSACEWQRAEWLRRIRFLPTDGETVEEHYNDKGRQARLFLEIRKNLRVIGERIRAAED